MGLASPGPSGLKISQCRHKSFGDKQGERKKVWMTEHLVKRDLSGWAILCRIERKASMIRWHMSRDPRTWAGSHKDAWEKKLLGRGNNRCTGLVLRICSGCSEKIKEANISRTEQGEERSKKSKGPDYVGHMGFHKNFSFCSEKKEKRMIDFERKNSMIWLTSQKDHLLAKK